MINSPKKMRWVSKEAARAKVRPRFLVLFFLNDEKRAKSFILKTASSTKIIYHIPLCLIKPLLGSGHAICLIINDLTPKYPLKIALNRDFRPQKSRLRIMTIIYSWPMKKMKKPVDKLRKRKRKYIPPADHPWRRYNPSLHHNFYLERI